MTEKAAATYTPGTANQSIAANQYLTGVQTIKGDSKLLAANIKKGVSIFGVTGTWEGFIVGAADIYNKGTWGAGTARVITYGAEGKAALTATYVNQTMGTNLWIGFTKDCYGYTKIIAEGTDFSTVTGSKSDSYFRGYDSAGIMTNYYPVSATATKLTWDLDVKVINAGVKQQGISLCYNCSITRIYLA